MITGWSRWSPALGTKYPNMIISFIIKSGSDKRVRQDHTDRNSGHNKLTLTVKTSLHTVLQPVAPAHGSPATAQCHGSASQSEYIAQRLIVSAFRACAGPRPGEHLPKSLTPSEIPLAGRPSPWRKSSFDINFAFLSFAHISPSTGTMYYITTSMWATQLLTHARGARPTVEPQSCREMWVKLRNHQNINATNPARKETRFPFHYHVTFRVCRTVKSSHRAKIVSRGYLIWRIYEPMCVCNEVMRERRGSEADRAASLPFLADNRLTYGSR
jgi:hypothetical protein